jgi:acetyltransferase-like isoleucine patch superfamily enzyme
MGYKTEILSILREIAEPWRVRIHRLKWRRLNPHNYTVAGTRFPVNKVTVGRETYGRLNVYCYNNSKASNLIIGNYCSIAQSAKFLLAGNHRIDTLLSFPVMQYYLKETPNESKGDIIIDDDVWLGENVTVLSGVHIGRGAVIAAGSVVTRDIPPYALGGVFPVNQ